MSTYTCKYCGQPSNLDPVDQTPPDDYCHPEDHGMLTDDAEIVYRAMLAVAAVPAERHTGAIFEIDNVTLTKLEGG